MTRMGVNVPIDLAIVGYDDIEFAGAAAVPPSSPCVSHASCSVVLRPSCCWPKAMSETSMCINRCSSIPSWSFGRRQRQSSAGVDRVAGSRSSPRIEGVTHGKPAGQQLSRRATGRCVMPARATDDVTSLMVIDSRRRQ